jgi:glycosyltransferase involved in cell wall biosynthesis
VRVLFIHTFYKLPGGEDAVVQNEIDLLRNGGHEVELLSFSNSGSGLFKLLGMPFNPSSYQKTKVKLAAFAPDIVHIHNLHFAASASVIRAIHHSGIPMVMTVHNYRLLCPSASLFHDNKFFLNSLKTEFPWDAVKKGVYQNSRLITLWLAFSNYLHRKLGTWHLIDTYVFLSEHSRQLFLDSSFKLDLRNTAIKPNFAMETICRERPLTNTYFLYVGRLTEEKGLRVLLEAFRLSGLWLKVAGIGPLSSLATSYAKQNSNIEYLGQQTREEVDLLLDKAESLVFPSLWYETFGMIVIEAFAKAVPVITSDLGNMKLLVNDGVNGRTFEPGSSADLKTKSLELNNMTAEEKRMMRVSAKATYDLHYNPKSNLDMLLKIYTDTINNSKAS